MKVGKWLVFTTPLVIRFLNYLLIYSFNKCLESAEIKETVYIYKIFLASTMQWLSMKVVYVYLFSLNICRTLAHSICAVGKTCSTSCRTVIILSNPGMESSKYTKTM